MKKYAVGFRRVETRIVWAHDEDDAIDRAMEIDPGDKINEDTLDVWAEDAEDTDVPLNKPEDLND